MANSGIQIIGYVLALGGLAATIAATLMVEWKRDAPREGGNFMGIRTLITYFMDLPCPLCVAEVQIFRAGMLLNILLSVCGLLLSTIGLKCTKCLDGNRSAKNHFVMAGGIFIMCSGLLMLSTTSWYASTVVQSSEHSRRFDLSSAMFVSWTGAVLALVGGAFIGIRCPANSIRSSFKSSNRKPVSTTATDYI